MMARNMLVLPKLKNVFEISPYSYNQLKSRTVEYPSSHQIEWKAVVLNTFNCRHPSPRHPLLPASVHVNPFRSQFAGIRNHLNVCLHKSDYRWGILSKLLLRQNGLSHVNSLESSSPLMKLNLSTSGYWKACLEWLSWMTLHTGEQCFIYLYDTNCFALFCFNLFSDLSFFLGFLLILAINFPLRSMYRPSEYPLSTLSIFVKLSHR